MLPLEAQPRARHICLCWPRKRPETIFTDKFTSIIALEHRIVFVGPHALLEAVYVVFEPKARYIQIEIRVAVLASRRIEVHHVVIFVGIVLHTDFVFDSGHAQALEIQETTGIVHLVILAAHEFFAVYPYRFGLRDNRNVAAVITQGIAFALTTHSRKSTYNATHLICADGRPRIRILCTKSNHTSKRGPLQRKKSQVGILPCEVAQVEHPVPRGRPEIDLVHLLERRRRLVARLAVHIAEQGVYSDAIAHNSLNGEFELLIDLSIAIAHRHLHGLVTVRLQVVRHMRRIGRHCNFSPVQKDIRIPNRERIYIESKRPRREREQTKEQGA